MRVSVIDLAPYLASEQCPVITYYFSNVNGCNKYSTEDKQFALFYNIHIEVLICLLYTLKGLHFSNTFKDFIFNDHFSLKRIQKEDNHC